MPRLKHGRVESIDQLVWYHTQFNTPAEWRHQFCSSETRLDRYAVHPKWLTFRFCKPKKQSCSVEYLSFLIRIILDLIRWYPVRHTFDHCIEGISPPVFSISTVDLWRRLVLLAPYLPDVDLPPWPCGHRATFASGPPKSQCPSPMPKLTSAYHRCRAINDKGMVFSNTWVYSKKDTRDVHTGWWSLVNYWREGSEY